MKDESDQEQVLATLKKHYRALKELFRYYSAVGDGNPFCIQYNSFLTMVKHFGMNPSHLDCDVIFKGGCFCFGLGCMTTSFAPHNTRPAPSRMQL